MIMKCLVTSYLIRKEKAIQKVSTPENFVVN